jgi:hypothetical protein
MNELIRLKIDLLLRGIDFSDTQFKEYLENSIKGNNIDPSHGLFNYHDTKSYVPNEIILRIDSDTIRVETRSNKESIYKAKIKNKKPVLIIGDTIYETIIVERPECYSLVSPCGRYLDKYINLMGKDCLRIYPKLNCDFDNEKYKCKFCGVNAKSDRLNDNDLLNEYLWAFRKAYDIINPKSMFISTGTHFDINYINFFIKYFIEINKYTNNKLLSKTVFVPSPNILFHDIDRLFCLGLGIISFNLEVWNNDLFTKYCYGKEKYFKRETYIKLIKYCSNKFGFGKVKTNFVAGLDEKYDLINGIKYLGQLGCFSSCTIFYPTPGAQLGKSFQNLDIDYYIDVYKSIYETAVKYNLSIPWTKETRISGLEWDIVDYV